jgi:hypothetical protein
MNTQEEEIPAPRDPQGEKRRLASLKQRRDPERCQQGPHRLAGRNPGCGQNAVPATTDQGVSDRERRIRARCRDHDH